jgi:alpha-tubulin suppressor-like RCC1 family protein
MSPARPRLRIAAAGAAAAVAAGLFLAPAPASAAPGTASGAAASHGPAMPASQGPGSGFPVLSVSAALDHTCAVRTDHTLWCWGYNTGGELGTGDYASRSTRAQVGTAGNWAAVSAGLHYTCAVRTDRTLWCWGENDYGELGLGAGVDGTNTPVQVGTGTSWATVSTSGITVYGDDHTCAVRTDHTLWCWGKNDYGQLGDGSARNAYTPVRVGTDANWATVSAGESSTCAVRTDRTLWCWGLDYYQQGGSASDIPVQVGSAAGWATVSLSVSGGCATRTDHTLWCWERSDPAQVGTAADWAAVSVGRSDEASEDHTCAVRTDHTLWCWGDNSYGELGTGAASASDDTPAQVGTAASWAAVSVGPQSACATRTDGTLWCWGDNSFSQLGTGQRSFFSSPRQVPGTGWAAVSAGTDHTCAIGAGSTLWCWGDNETGQLGTGPALLASSPRQVPGTGWAAVSVGDDGIGDDHTCAIRTDHTLWCWGGNGYGQLGTGGTGSASTPVQVGTDTDWATVSAGDVSTCATRTDQTLWCWGDNVYGELGIGETSTSTSTPVQVGTDTNWVTVSARDLDACATRTDHTLWCWGDNYLGQLGTGGTGSASTPVQVGTAANWVTVSAGEAFTCATRAGRTLWCWGDNGFGELGTGGTSGISTNTPARVGTAADWVTVSAGGEFTCATRTDRTLWCWGYNYFGQLGTGGTGDASTPVQVGAAADWVTVSAGGEGGYSGGHTCATRAGGTLWCWGDDEFGELGNGISGIVPTPRPVH